MVQIANPSRLNLKIELGKFGDIGEDVNGISTEGFFKMKTVSGAEWVRTQNQQITITGTNLQGTRVYLVHHRTDWDESRFTHIKLKNIVYKIVSISPDVENLPTSYDLVTVNEVSKNG